MSIEVARARSGRIWVKNIGLLLTGDIDAPRADADTLIIEDGHIVALGRAAQCDPGLAQTVIDCRGTAVCPGLIDSHVHPVFGDWTPRQNQLGWIESSLNGGVTTMISAGEVHLPGRPRDIVGLKALAITAQRAFENMRAQGVGGGVKVLAGAPVIEEGMVEADFTELAAAGVTLLGEIGLGSVKAGAQAARPWHPEHHPYRRPVDSGIGIDRQRCRPRGRCRHHRARQWRPYGTPLRTGVRAVRTQHARPRAGA